MPVPDFSRPTLDMLQRRAGQMCSNIDCRKVTSGPSEAADKAVIIGEPAHIYGAKPGSARYRAEMTDGGRAEITNGIWLCSNCHKMVDSDASRFSADVLFQWQEFHHAYVVSLLGSAGEKVLLMTSDKTLEGFDGMPPHARRIVRDRPPGWEYRLTAELLRELPRKALRRWRDLNRGLYTKPRVMLDADTFPAWVGAKIAEAGTLVPPLAKLYAEELKQAWGPDGVPGDPAEILHVCRLIAGACDALVQWEEDVRFAYVGAPFAGVLAALPGVAGAQLDRLGDLPTKLDQGLDELAASPDGPIIIDHSIVFEIPEGWNAGLERAFEDATRAFEDGVQPRLGHP